MARRPFFSRVIVHGRVVVLCLFLLLCSARTAPTVAFWGSSLSIVKSITGHGMRYSFVSAISGGSSTPRFSARRNAPASSSRVPSATGREPIQYPVTSTDALNQSHRSRLHQDMVYPVYGMNCSSILGVAPTSGNDTVGDRLASMTPETFDSGSTRSHSRNFDTSQYYRLTRPQVFLLFGVKPRLQVPAKVWRLAIFVFDKIVLPLFGRLDRISRWIHRTRKQQQPYPMSSHHASSSSLQTNTTSSSVIIDSALSLKCMYWKALVGCNRRSPAYDKDGWSLDILPIQSTLVRAILRHGNWLFPRLNHAHLELRTVFLDQQIRNIVERHCQGLTYKGSSAINNTSKTKPIIRLISFGAGYDTRSMRLVDQGIVDEAFELDLPQVVAAKRYLIANEDTCFQRNKPRAVVPELYALDLNDIKVAQRVLERIVSESRNDTDKTPRRYVNILVFEGVLVHLQKGSAHEILKMASNVLGALPNDSTVGNYMVFADMLDNVRNRDYGLAFRELESTGWNLDIWVGNPTKAPHMGLAHL